MLIGLATWGVAHLVDGGPQTPASACVTSGIRPLAFADVRGTGEVCAAATAARASVSVDQLRPEGTYTTLLAYHPDNSTTCAAVCVADAGSQALASRTVRVVDTTNADQFGRLEISQEVAALNLAHGSAVQLVLMEFVRRQAPQLNELTFPTMARHRVDRLPDDDAETPVAEAVFRMP
jgi:hypothetical protein